MIKTKSDMAEDRLLFKVTTRGCGTFYVIATSFDAAAQAVNGELESQDYGYSGDRCVERVEKICRETFMSNGKRVLYGEKDENHLIICPVNGESKKED